MTGPRSDEHQIEKITREDASKKVDCNRLHTTGI